MKFTFGFNIAKQKINWKKLTKHNLRTHKIDDKNKNINPKLSKYNILKKIGDRNNILKNYCHNYVTELNKRLIKDGHKKRCLSDQDYVNKHADNAERTVVVSLGSKSTRNKLEKQAEANAINKVMPKIKDIRNYGINVRHMDPNRLENLINDTLSKLKLRTKHQMRTKTEPLAVLNYMRDFNKRHKYLHFTNTAEHVDEQLIHGHARMVATPGYTNTKIPRPSFSFSKAIRKTGHSKDGRKALRNIQATEAPIALKYLSKATNIHLNLTRTGLATNLSGSQYKHYAKMSDMAKNEGIKASQATNKAHSASVAQSKIIHGLNSTFTSASISANNSISATIQSLNNDNRAWHISLSNSLTNSATHSASIATSSTVKSINSNIAVSQSNWTNSEKAILSKSASTSAKTTYNSAHSALRKPIDNFECNYMNGGDGLQHWQANSDKEAISELHNITNKVTKKARKIKEDKYEAQLFRAQQLVLLTPDIKHVSKPMGRSLIRFYKKDGSGLDINKIKKHIKDYNEFGYSDLNPPLGISDGSVVHHGLSAVTYLAGFDIQNHLNESKVQQVSNNFKDFSLNNTYKHPSDSDEFQP